jgi:K+-transporting ATPase ATPase C chain
MNEILASLRLWALTLVTCCVAYPLVVLAFAQAVVPGKAQGSLIVDDSGTVVGSRLLAQGFTKPEHFWPRPSAVGYDASGAGGSNLSPTNALLTERGNEIVDVYDLPEGTLISADLVAASGSGLDPHIALTAAKQQIPRIAAARGLTEEEVLAAAMHASDSPTLEALGEEPLVNVLLANLALDAASNR